MRAGLILPPLSPPAAPPASIVARPRNDPDHPARLHHVRRSTRRPLRERIDSGSGDRPGEAREPLRYREHFE